MAFRFIVIVYDLLILSISNVVFCEGFIAFRLGGLWLVVYGFMSQGLRCMGSGSGLRVEGLRFRGYVSRVRGQDGGMRAEGLGRRA